MWTKNPRYNSGRIEISLSETLDYDFGIGALKNSAKLTQSLRDVLGPEIRIFRKSLEAKYRITPTKETETLNADADNFTNRLLDNAGSLSLPRIVGATTPATKLN